eukprot:CAMPEP_0116822974 /NCGR_PEP_ID=MMETSP0418-20121206/577_1 /TAXON_ID=1158023 /ORGANISM="Astrosyne radiata, Strain 13vi08-1A" /LENGTH=91 /DNA_ID=CAMNT_0004451169 /DNA_START=17 /DNA_END=292 /DNA_ORIENTATION=+
MMELWQSQQEAFTTDMADNNKNLASILSSALETEANRVHFLLSDLLSERLRKLEEYPLYMRAHVDSMSPQEVRIEEITWCGDVSSSHVSVY